MCLGLKERVNREDGGLTRGEKLGDDYSFVKAYVVGIGLMIGVFGMLRALKNILEIFM